MTIFRSMFAQGLALTCEETPRRSSLEDEIVSLFEQLREPVLRYLLSCRVPVPDAEEIVQEVFLLLFQQASSGKLSVNPTGWIFRTAHNYVLKHRDQSRRHAERFEWCSQSPEALADPSVPADVALQDAQTQQSIMAVVQALPEQDQHCLHLRAEGLRYREIAEVLGISLGSVSNSLQRSLARIARAKER